MEEEFGLAKLLWTIVCFAYTLQSWWIVPSSSIYPSIWYGCSFHDMACFTIRQRGMPFQGHPTFLHAIAKNDPFPLQALMSWRISHITLLSLPWPIEHYG